MNSAVFLDLDGTLVRAFPEGDTTRGPRTRQEVEILPGTKASIRRLQEAGFEVVIVTNKPDVARGIIPLEHAWLIANEIATEIGVHYGYSYLCPHDGEWCACRKPRPGMIYQAAVEHELDLTRCWLIGDRETDREAAIRAGIPSTQAIKIETNQGVKEAVEWILQTSK